MSVINKDFYFIVYCLLLPFLVFYSAYVPSGYIRKFNRYGDYSYGMYIYAFPVQQSAAALIPNISVTTMIVVSFGVTLFLSMLSWHLIEKRLLDMKGAYVVIEDFVQNNGLTRRFNRTH
jgi:peptidoglycan/LPS O-acetylase OafA/YrhL